jgi:hypothetical protein
LKITKNELNSMPYLYNSKKWTGWDLNPRPVVSKTSHHCWNSSSCCCRSNSWKFASRLLLQWWHGRQSYLSFSGYPDRYVTFDNNISSLIMYNINKHLIARYMIGRLR